MRETPFILTNRPEVVLPIEVSLYTHQLTTFKEALNNTPLGETPDLLPSA